MKIVDIQIGRLQTLLTERKISLELTNEAKILIADEGYDLSYGARPLKRAIQKYIQNPLSMLLLEGKFKKGETVIIDAGQDGKMRFCTKEEVLEHQ